MHAYEIRIITADGKTPRLVGCALPSDFAAIRRAHAVTRPGQGVEVWRDGDCIFANQHDHPMMAPPRSHPDAKADYEVRILRPDLTPSLIWNIGLGNDADVIRSAVKAARGHAVEIWRGMDCIFRAPG